MNSKFAFNRKMFVFFGAVRLRQASVAVKFVTNTTKESKRNLLERLRSLNFDLQVKHPKPYLIQCRCFYCKHLKWFFFWFVTSGVSPFFSWLQEKEIFTSLSAARSLLEQKQHRPLLLVEDNALEDFTGMEVCVCVCVWESRRDHASIWRWIVFLYISFSSIFISFAAHQQPNPTTWK